ncbi:hypothetical protein [Demequina lutea]|uniref:Oligosaccharide repeat unit polymerase n=1 Tax=Demequina lutea TaxID=431489 RepID=A0A7Z0CIZ5_9MICO|nr:hypothetical protein [Demequina lutea]NYI40408.1 hypothetical protein [Demequina lutea]
MFAESRVKVSWTLLGLATVAAVATIVGSGELTATLGPACIPLAPLLLLWLFRARFQIVALSPVWVIAIVVGGAGSIGCFLAASLNSVGGGGIVLYLPASDRLRTAAVFGFATLFFSIGSLLVALFSERRSQVVIPQIKVSQSSQARMLFLAAAPIAMVVVALGGALLLRDNYLRGAYLSGGFGRALFGFGEQLATAGVALAGYVLAAGRGANRLGAMLLTVAYFSLFFSLGTRRLALVPILLVVGMLMARPKRTWFKLAAATIIATLLLPLPLYLRGQNQHGLLPYLSSLSGYHFDGVDWLSTINNVLITFPITGMTAFYVDKLPLSYMLVSLDPLPGQLAGWYEIASNMTLNPWTPYSTIGELWNYGFVPSALVWVSFGIVAAWLDRVVRRLWVWGVPIVSLAVVGLSALFALQAIQYNLRSSSRMLWYAALIAIGGLIYTSLQRSRHRSKQASQRVSQFGDTVAEFGAEFRPTRGRLVAPRTYRPVRRTPLPRRPLSSQGFSQPRIGE